MFFNMFKSTPWYKKKKIILPLGIIAILFLARLILVPVAQKELNKFLATFSPSLYFHMDDLDIHIIRGAYSFERVIGRVRTQKDNFIVIDKVDVSLAWRELFKGRLVTDIAVTGLDISYTKALANALANAPEKKEKIRDRAAEDAKDTLFPLKVERVDLHQSKLTLDDYPSLEENKKFQISGIKGRVTNLTPDKSFPLSSYDLQATFLGNSVLKTSGRLNLLKDPVQWDVDSVLKGFDLTRANVFLKRKVPFTFTQGKLDLYVEAESQDGTIHGYLKPFLANVDVIKSSEHWKGAKQGFIEVLSAFGNLILRTSDTHTVATRVPFKINKEGFQVDSSEAIEKVLQNAFQQKLRPGVEDRYQLK